ncbi:MAG TPA: hypothetical protein VFQ22_04980 [Longimicrobiales bacterium]|nr:hypothetical protein [Longimicrobiales bacterium]
MRTTVLSRRWLPLAAMLALAACEETTTDPAAEELTPSEELELTVLEDDETQEETFDIATVTEEVAIEMGDAGASEAHGLIGQARAALATARDARALGERRAALEAAREARVLIARALLASGGEDALNALIERIEELAITLDSDDDDVFDDPELLQATLEDVASEARERLAEGDTVGAAERAVFGEQVARYHRGRRHHRGEILEERARLAVALAEQAVQLAERLVEGDEVLGQGVPARDDRPETHDHRNRWLAHANRMLNIAQRALDNGHWARAVHFAWHARWAALKAVVLPGGVTEEEQQAMGELADTLLAQATEAVGDDAPELHQRLLARAGRLIERGHEALEQGHVRGVAALWRGAVICAWLIA